MLHSFEILDSEHGELPFAGSIYYEFSLDPAGLHVALQLAERDVVSTRGFLELDPRFRVSFGCWHMHVG